MNRKNKFSTFDWKSSPFVFIREVHCGSQWKVEARCKFCQSVKLYQKGSLMISRSCGCRRAEFSAARNRIHGHSHTRKQDASPTYLSWVSIKDRCLKKSHKSYKDYGGRGILVCKRWRDSFTAFLEDMGERPERMTIGRIDNDKGYYKENCEWQTCRQQARNRRDSKIIMYKGKSRPLCEWSELCGVAADTLSFRLRSGWDVGRALNTVPRKQSNNREARRFAL